MDALKEKGTELKPLLCACMLQEPSKVLIVGGLRKASSWSTSRECVRSCIQESCRGNRSSILL
ncbi:hypothetical protein PVK06_025178 [Gossypium arboreum]|uniref:Uncharacterized protein n=1 Tax=Gossypium arboreum TaxID=29729 RepID=A0ABR0PFQ4_GOSAR|nr:hypothetical protein PVK06_025178 [Gossypium arboreum]